MVTGEVPPRPILRHVQFMAGSKVPSEHLAAPAAFEADDIIAVNGATDRHRGYSLDFSFGRRFAEADERLMHGRD